MSNKRPVCTVGKDEKIDTKRHSFADLVQWQPPGQNTLKAKWNRKREQMLEDMSCQSTGECWSVGVVGWLMAGWVR